MLKSTDTFGTTTYYMSARKELLESLKENEILYHDGREPGEEWLKVLYKLFYSIYTEGKSMFFMWKEIDSYHSYKIVDDSDFVLIEFEIPNELKLLRTSYTEWSSLGIDFLDNACGIKDTNDYLKETYGRDLLQSLDLAITTDDKYEEYQYFIDHLEYKWVKSVKYINRLIR